jgi:hypothetical protein
LRAEGWNKDIGNAFVRESKNTQFESSVRFLLLTKTVDKTLLSKLE